MRTKGLETTHIMCVCVCVCVCEEAAVLLFENSRAYDHLDEIACSYLKQPLEQ